MPLKLHLYYVLSDHSGQPCPREGTAQASCQFFVAKTTSLALANRVCTCSVDTLMYRSPGWLGWGV
jgi:hypothetical protein